MPGDSRVERVLGNLNTLIEQPTGWSPSDAHAWQAVAADAKRVIESLDELGPDTGIEQGVSRLEMLRFLRGEHSDVQVRYRGHAVSGEVNPLDGLVLLWVHYTEHDGKASRAQFEGGAGDHEAAIDLLRNIDVLVDASLAVQPEPLTGYQFVSRGGEVRTNAVRSSATEFLARVTPEAFDRWMRKYAEDVTANAIDRALGVAKQRADATATDPVANAAVWDVIDRLQKLRPVDVPTEQDRAEAEADDEREGKARARAADFDMSDQDKSDAHQSRSAER